MGVKTIYDTVHVTVIDTIHRVIADSVTLEALKNSQLFYNDAYGNLLGIAGLLLAIIIFATAGLGYINQSHAKKVLAEAKKHSEEIAVKEADRVQREINDRFKLVSESVVTIHIVHAMQLERGSGGKQLRDAFWQYYLALSKCGDLPADKADWADDAIDGIRKHWRSIAPKKGAKHPAITALTEYMDASFKNGTPKQYDNAFKALAEIEGAIDQQRESD